MMAQDQDQRAAAAAAATDELIRATVGTVIALASIVGFQLAIAHRDDVVRAGRRVLAAVRGRRRQAADTGLQVAEFNATVTAWGHGHVC